ncbi:TPA: hypothetical protein ACFOIS_001145 [Neisseria meningitidis]
MRSIKGKSWITIISPSNKTASQNANTPAILTKRQGRAISSAAGR